MFNYNEEKEEFDLLNPDPTISFDDFEEGTTADEALERIREMFDDIDDAEKYDNLYYDIDPDDTGESYCDVSGKYDG